MLARAAELDEQRDPQPAEEQEYDNLKSELTGMKAIEKRFEGTRSATSRTRCASPPRAPGGRWSRPATPTPPTTTADNVVTSAPGRWGLAGIGVQFDRGDKILEKASGLSRD